MEHWIVDVMMCAISFQFFKGVLKGKPLANAEMKLALLFHLLENEEILPVTEVLDAGDTMGEGVFDGEFIAIAALVGSRRRDDSVDEALRGFAKDAGGFPARVEVDGPALRRLCFAGDTGGGKCGSIGDGDVSVDAIEKCRVIAGDLVEVLAGRKNFLFPQSMIPVSAG